MSDMITAERRETADVIANVIVNRSGERIWRGNKLEDHQIVEDGMIFNGELPPEPTKSTPKSNGEKRTRRTFKDIEAAVLAMNEDRDTNFWTADTRNGIVFVRDDQTIRTFTGEDKKIDFVLKWIEGFSDCLDVVEVA